MDVLVEEALRRAFVARGCPICRLGETAARRDLRFVLDEHVNALAVRRKLLASPGWCRRHVWHLLRLEGLVEGDGFGTAIIADGLPATLRRGSPGTARPELVRAGQDPTALRAVAAATEQYWRPTVCRECLGVPAPVRCRPHLLADAARGRLVDGAEHRDLVEEITAHLAAYARSFIWEQLGDLLLEVLAIAERCRSHPEDSGSPTRPSSDRFYGA